MAFHTGTATNHIDMVDELIQFATSDHILTVAVNAAGTGYTVGDVLTVIGGTSLFAATFEVVTITGGGGTGPITATPPWVVRRRTQEALSATIATAGTAYTVGDQITLATEDAIGEGTAAVFNVDSITGGGGTGPIDVLSLVTAGDYEAEQTVPGDIAGTGGTGSGAELNVTFQDAGTTTDATWIIEGSGSGAEVILVGGRTFTEGSAFNWELAGFTAYTAALIYEDQAGISPGRYDASVANDKPGAYVPLNNSSFTYELYITSSRIKVQCAVGTSDVSAYLGFPNRFGTSLEFVYPLIVLGCTNDFDRVFSDTGNGYGGMVDPHGSTNTNEYGPGFIRLPGGTWDTITNRFGTGSNNDHVIVSPCQDPPIAVSQEDRFQSVSLLNAVFPRSGFPGIQSLRMLPSPGDIVTLLPTMLIGWEAQPGQFLGELDETYVVSADTDATNIVSGNTIEVDGEIYVVYQNCTRSNTFAHFVQKRA